MKEINNLFDVEGGRQCDSYYQGQQRAVVESHPGHCLTVDQVQHVERDQEALPSDPSGHQGRGVLLPQQPVRCAGLKKKQKKQQLTEPNSSSHLLIGSVVQLNYNMKDVHLSAEMTTMTNREKAAADCQRQANPHPGVVQEEGGTEGGEEVEDAQLVHLPAKLVLPALEKGDRSNSLVIMTSHCDKEGGGNANLPNSHAGSPPS